MPRDPQADAAIISTDLSIARSSGRRDAGDRVVDGVTFTLGYGEALVVMGATGSGRSSLLSLLSGQGEAGLVVDGGEAKVHGIDVRRPGRSHRVMTYLTGMLRQDAGATLAARFTVGEIIGEPVTSRDRRVNERALAVRVAALLDEVELPLGAAAKYPYELSAGMRQRVALARALMLRPRLLIADEPLAGLDVEVRHVVEDAILRRREEYGMAALVATNDTEIAGVLGARRLVLRDGHVVGQDDGQGLMWTPSATDARHGHAF